MIIKRITFSVELIFLFYSFFDLIVISGIRKKSDGSF